MSTSPMFGIGELRDRRGSEHVTFAEIADALVAFAERSRHDSAAIDAFASFLATLGDAREVQEGSTPRSLEVE
jgi:hypothetical protein